MCYPTPVGFHHRQMKSFGTGGGGPVLLCRHASQNFVVVQLIISSIPDNVVLPNSDSNDVGVDTKKIKTKPAKTENNAGIQV